MSKMKVTFKELAGRITGVSLPIFGVNPPVAEREVVRETFVFLEDRRALYHELHREDEEEVAESILTSRAELTAALKRLPEDSEATSSLKAMRAACREYLDGDRPRGPRGWRNPIAFNAALGRLRAIFGVQVAYLAVKYGIDLEGELLQIIPPELRDATYLKG